MNKKIVTLKAFEEVASKNGYEVFTAEKVASYYKEGLMKSMSGQMGFTEKEEFASDIIGLQKAVVSDENGKETVRYYRKKQVEWETSQDGTILKGIEGIYLDTPENRRLKRVGQPYIASEEIVKSICEADENIMKAVRTGRYADTSENRRLHRVGQPYKTREKKGEETESKGGNKSSSEKIGEVDYEEVKNMIDWMKDKNGLNWTYSDASKSVEFLKKVPNKYRSNERNVINSMRKTLNNLQSEFLKRENDKSSNKEEKKTEQKSDGKKETNTKLDLSSIKEAVQKEFGGRFENGKYSGGTSISFEEKGGEITVTVMDKGKSVKDKLENIAKKLGAEGIHDKEKSGSFSTVYKFKKNSEGVSKKEEPKPEQKTEEKKVNIDDMLNIHKTFNKEDLKGLDDSSLNKLKDELQKKYDEAWEIDSKAIGRLGVSAINNNSSEYSSRLFYVKNEIKKRGESKKEEPKPEENKETKSEKKDTPKSDDTQEEKYTRVKFDDLPDSGKVNLKKYLTTKRKSAVDNKLSDISKMDTSELKKMEKEAVVKFNKDFGESKKSQRAEDLYYIMKIKGELSKRK